MRANVSDMISGWLWGSLVQKYIIFNIHKAIIHYLPPFIGKTNGLVHSHLEKIPADLKIRYSCYTEYFERPVILSSLHVQWKMSFPKI